MKLLHERLSNIFVSALHDIASSGSGGVQADDPAHLSEKKFNVRMLATACALASNYGETMFYLGRDREVLEHLWKAGEAYQQAAQSHEQGSRYPVEEADQFMMAFYDMHCHFTDY